MEKQRDDIPHFDSDFYESDVDDAAYFDILQYRACIYPAHFHSTVEVYYIVRGGIRTRIEGETREMTEGDILFINGLDIHSFDVDRISEVTVLQFGQYYMRDFYEEFGNVCLANFLCDKDFNRSVYELMGEIAREAKRYNGLDRKIAVNRLLNRLVRRYGTVLPRKKGSKAGEIIKYVYQNYDSPELGLETIAEHFHYAPVTISRLFSKFIGVDIRKFINNIRIDNARVLLENRSENKLTVTEIATRCGFDNMATFYRNYKLLAGASDAAKDESDVK